MPAKWFPWLAVGICVGKSVIMDIMILYIECIDYLNFGGTKAQIMFQYSPHSPTLRPNSVLWCLADFQWLLPTTCYTLLFTTCCTRSTFSGIWLDFSLLPFFQILLTVFSKFFLLNSGCLEAVGGVPNLTTLATFTTSRGNYRIWLQHLV